MKRRRCSAFELMFKFKVLEEKTKPTKERKILFPHKYSNNADDQADVIIDIAAYR